MLPAINIYDNEKTSNMVSFIMSVIENNYNYIDLKFINNIFDAHKKVNQKYDGNEYKYHLLLAFYFGYKYSMLCPKFNLVKLAIIGHDAIEDTNFTYNDILKLFDSNIYGTHKYIAEIIYVVTNEKGRTRKERANKKYYKGIRKKKKVY
jgi:hypothetical protein